MPKNEKRRVNAAKFELREKLTAYMLAAPAVILLVIFTVYPIFYLIYRSFLGGNLISKTTPFVQFDNYRTLLKSTEFHKVLANTVIYTAVVVCVTIVLAVLIAVWLNEKCFRGLNDAAQAFLFTPHIISVVSVSTLFLWLMDPTIGFINNMLNKMGLESYPFLSSPKTALFSLCLVMIWKSVGYYSLLMMAALQNIPVSVYEAAELDDAPKVKTFFKITLPMISPTILFTSVVATIQSFRVFDTVNVMTQGGPVNATNTLVYYIYEYAFRYGKPGLACAAGVVLLIFVGLITLIQFRVGKNRVYYQ